MCEIHFKYCFPSIQHKHIHSRILYKYNIWSVRFYNNNNNDNKNIHSQSDFINIPQGIPYVYIIHYKSKKI